MTMAFVSFIPATCCGGEPGNMFLSGLASSSSCPPTLSLKPFFLQRAGKHFLQQQKSLVTKHVQHICSIEFYD